MEVAFYVPHIKTEIKLNNQKITRITVGCPWDYEQEEYKKTLPETVKAAIAAVEEQGLFDPDATRWVAVDPKTLKPYAA